MVKCEWDSRGVEDMRRQCIHHFAWTFFNEKAVFKVGAMFANSQSKATMYRWFRALFATVSMQQKMFLHKYVTMDETCIHHFTLESNWQSTEWTAAGESHPKWQKMQISAGKVLASIFWDVQGILFLNYLEKGRRHNSKYYMALLVHLMQEIAKKWPQMKKKKGLFYQDSALCHKLITTMAKLPELHFELLPHPPYSLDLAPSDYWLFADLKRMP